MSSTPFTTLQGPEGWSGEALEEAARFDFVSLPWQEARKAGPDAPEGQTPANEGESDGGASAAEARVEAFREGGAGMTGRAGLEAAQATAAAGRAGEVTGADRVEPPAVSPAEARWEGEGGAPQQPAQVTCVKSTDSRRVLFVPEGALFGLKGGGRVYVKRYLINTLRRRVASAALGTKAAREFRLGHQLLEKQIPTPVPLAWAMHGRAVAAKAGGALGIGRKGEPPCAASYLLTREWPNRGSLRAVLKDRPGPEIWEAFARFLADAHGRGFYHDDCSAEHVLIAEEAELIRRRAEVAEQLGGGRFAFIDIDNGRLHDGGVPVSHRLTNLFQVLRSLRSEDLRPSERERFIELYLRQAQLTPTMKPEEMKHLIESIAKRKIGRSVFH